MKRLIKEPNNSNHHKFCIDDHTHSQMHLELFGHDIQATRSYESWHHRAQYTPLDNLHLTQLYKQGLANITYQTI